MDNMIKFESGEYREKGGEGEVCNQFNFNSVSSNKKIEDDLLIEIPNIEEPIKDKVNEESQPLQTDKSQHGPF
jgi:hypothetical protein